MLAAHPMIAMLPETGLLRRYVFSKAAQSVDPATLWEVDHRVQRIDRRCWEVAVDGDSAPGDSDATAAQGETDGSPLPVLELYRRLHAPECARCLGGGDSPTHTPAATLTPTLDVPDHPPTIHVIGDKDPRLVEYLPLLAALFPQEVYVIHIVRDPRDVLVSKIKAGWSERRNWRVNLAASRVQLAAADRDGTTIFGTRWIELRYEDLLSDPVRELQRITDAIGIEYSEQMLQFSDAAQRLSGGSIEEWKKETLGPLLSQNYGKWRSSLDHRQIDAVEGAMGRWIKRYGYEPTPGGAIRRFGYRTVFGVFAFFYSVWRRGRNGAILRRVRTKR